MRKLLLTLLLFCLLVSVADAQNRKKRGSFGKKKASYRYEIIGGLGAANFLGDLGGADQIGTHAFKDLEYTLTRSVLSLSMRYKIGKFFTVKNNLVWATVKGDDQLTKNDFRNNRNANFRSPIWELSTQLEFNFFKEQTGRVYKIRGVRGMKHKDRQVYLFGGGGLFYFNPKGYWNGKWYPLEPMHTEGVSYARINYLISVGGGLRLALNRYWGVGLELGLRYTFTDYIDDVSKSYPDPAIFNGDPVAAHFSNPALYKYPIKYGGNSSSLCSTCPGDQRGKSKYNDAYLFGAVTVGYKVMYRKRSRSKF